MVLQSPGGRFLGFCTVCVSSTIKEETCERIMNFLLLIMHFSFFFFNSVRQKQLKMFLREVTLCSILTFDKMLSCHCADFDQRKKVPLSAFFFFFWYRFRKYYYFLDAPSF